MNDIALTFALHAALFSLACIALRFVGKQVRLIPLSAGWACIAAYWAVSLSGHFLQAALPFSAALHWNWGGKLCAIAMGLAILFFTPSLQRNEVGLTWRIRGGSLGPAVIMIVAMCALNWIDAALSSVPRDLSLERLLFQGIMPGLDEELFFRGLILVFFVRAFGEGRELAGARFGLAEIMMSLLFGAMHGLHVSKGVVAIDWHTILITGTLGAGLMWLRQRTGSLIVPVIAHNILNFGESFF